MYMRYRQPQKRTPSEFDAVRGEKSRHMENACVINPRLGGHEIFDHLALEYVDFE